MFKILLLTCLLAISASSATECPSLDDLPVAQDGQFVCGFRWWETGADNPIQACNTDGTCYPGGGRKTLLDDMEFTALDGNYNPIGSLAVMPGCTFYEFSERNYQGSVKEYIPGIIPNYPGPVGATDTCPRGNYSFKCRCVQEMIDCQPSDSYTLILSCDNTDGSQVAGCDYDETSGTSYGQSASISIDVSTTVASEIQAGIGNSYDKFGVSTTTGYDWSTASQATFDKSKTVTVNAIAAAGEILTIEQAQGRCDDNISFSNFFKISNNRATAKGVRTVETAYYVRDVEGNLKQVPAPGTPE